MASTTTSTWPVRCSTRGWQPPTAARTPSVWASRGRQRGSPACGRSGGTERCTAARHRRAGRPGDHRRAADRSRIARPAAAARQDLTTADVRIRVRVRGRVQGVFFRARAVTRRVSPVWLDGCATGATAASKRRSRVRDPPSSTWRAGATSARRRPRSTQSRSSTRRPSGRLPSAVRGDRVTLRSRGEWSSPSAPWNHGRCGPVWVGKIIQFGTVTACARRVGQRHDRRAGERGSSSSACAARRAVAGGLLWASPTITSVAQAQDTGSPGCTCRVKVVIDDDVLGVSTWACVLSPESCAQGCACVQQGQPPDCAGPLVFDDCEPCGGQGQVACP